MKQTIAQMEEKNRQQQKKVDKTDKRIEKMNVKLATMEQKLKIIKDKMSNIRERIAIRNGTISSCQRLGALYVKNSKDDQFQHFYDVEDKEIKFTPE
jgi:septal ring factor EnvC (AmiA/AmiB activator)